MADTGPAKLPGLPALNLSDQALGKWVQAVAERLEVREGARGNPAEAVVLQRDLAGLKAASDYLTTPKTNPKPGETVIDLGGGLTATVAVDAFAESIRNSRLFKDLILRLDDPRRFDALPEIVRNVLLVDLAETAAKLGADITRVETKLQSANESLAMVVEQVTASVEGAQAGVREVTFASAQVNHAQAGKIVQVVASLDNYYQDGTPGRVTIESQMVATASRVTGLEGKYTLKINAGKAVVGFGLLASDSDEGVESDFIIMADRFALVGTNSTTGLVNTPDSNSVPFGVDTITNRIFMNAHVYLKGAMTIDAPGGRTLASGLRGSVNVWGDPTFWNGGQNLWNDAAASYTVWINLPGTNHGIQPPNSNHLVIGDTVTLKNNAGYVETKAWLGDHWSNPGMVLNGNMLIDGTVAASKINTHGLTISDANGNPILVSGVNLDPSFFAPFGGLHQLAAIGFLPAGNVSGLSGLATLIGKLDATNIGTFIESAAIGTALIGDLAVNTFKIGKNAVTVPMNCSGGNKQVFTSNGVKADYPPFTGTQLTLKVFSSYDPNWQATFTYLDAGFLTALLIMQCSTEANRVNLGGASIGGSVGCRARGRVRLVRYIETADVPFVVGMLTDALSPVVNTGYPLAIGTVLNVGTVFDTWVSVGSDYMNQFTGSGSIAIPSAGYYGVTFDLGNNWDTGNWQLPVAAEAIILGSRR